MKKTDKEKWIKDVFDSLKGSHRAKPGPQLFAKIEHQIYSPETKIIPMRQWSYAVAAAVLILAINIFALRQYAQNKESNIRELVASDDSGQPLISNYKIYE